jgi:hypothetical protein
MKHRTITDSDRALQARFRQAGLAILLIGFIGAALAYRFAPPDDPVADAIALMNRKRYEYQMELMGGKANLLAEDLKEGFANLWRGRQLAHTLAYLSGSGALACFFIAHRLSYSPPAAKPAHDPHR